MVMWLNCKISPGQFTGEYAVRGKMFNAKEFSLFAPKKDLQFNEETFEKGGSVEGSICVIKLQEKGDLVLVELPQPTFENGQTITVNASQVK
jgi:hypothetical protein